MKGPADTLTLKDFLWICFALCILPFVIITIVGLASRYHDWLMP